ncbi:MAG: glycosyltransferase [Terracidiphilus sp.]|jgi:glycosyltransferase involved in cell wall biosynthesis
MPAVSIVTTTFNRTEYLKQAIQSAVSQTFTDFELLVCDDGGLEETRQLCESFHDDRILHTVNPARLGIAMNTYAGVLRARSDAITFLNDDDRWTRDFLALCAVPVLEDSDVVLAFSDHWLIDVDGSRLVDATDANTREYGREGLPAGRVDAPVRLMARLSIPLAMAAVFRKSQVDWSKYTNKVEGAYDSYIAYSLLRGHGEVIYVRERLTEYRTHGGGASAEFHRHTTEGLAYVHYLILEDPAYKSIARDIHRSYRGLEKHLVKLSLAKCDIPSAVTHCARLVRHGLI